MANTVNDVMNVIASPDYGIKNIAGTNQEILAILMGTHNSQNNIHNIVNDVKNLLQTLVETTSQNNKPIEIGDKSSKINSKHIQGILDETKGIRKAIISLEKAIVKQGGKNVSVAKLSDKASQKVADAMIKNMGNQKGGGMAALVDAFTKLKDISLKDIILGKHKLKKIKELFKDAKKDLKIKEKDLTVIIKLINAAPEMVDSLSKVGWKINRIIKNETIKKLGEILVGKENSLLTIARSLKNNEKTFNNATKTAKNLKEIISHLNRAMIKLLFASLFAKLASGGIKSIEIVIDKLIPLAQKLIKNQKDIEKGAKVAKNITVLVGNLLLTSIFLTVAAVFALPAILGAMALGLMIDFIVPVVEKLSKNNKNMGKAVLSALILTAFTGLMAISTFFLATIAKNGLEALWGSVVVLGVVSISMVTFELLNGAKKNILIGAGLMIIMSISLLLFGIALKKITDATKDVTWKQVAITASMIVILALSTAVMGEPTTASFIALGSLTMLLLSTSLIVFGTALGKIAQATEKLTWKKVLLVAGSMATMGAAVAAMGALSPLIAFGSIALGSLSLALQPFLKRLSELSSVTQQLKMEDIDIVNSSMMSLGLGVAKMAFLTIPITLGSIALGAMGTTLYLFVKSLKLISDMGGVPIDQVDMIISAMQNIGDFFKNNGLKYKVIKNAYRYNHMMIPFRFAVHQLSKLKKIGSIPTKLVYQVLDSMGAISQYYINNPISDDIIEQAYMYKTMLKPFGNTLKHLVKLKNMGSLPMKLVYQTLNAMSAIADYYINNPIRKKAIRSARRYKRMLRPFGKTIESLVKLKNMGNLPMKLVYQTLNTMSAIADYYTNNPIEKSAIKSARKYKRMLRPFGKTIENLVKLKNMGNLPMKLVYQTLNTMRAIADYYINNPIEKSAIKNARKYKRMLKPFGKAIEHLTKLKELGNIPTSGVENTLTAMSSIAMFYNTVSLDNIGDVEWKTEITKLLVENFTTMAGEIQDKFGNLKMIDYGAVMSITITFKSIINFYKHTKFFKSERKINRINDTIKMFLDTASYLKDNLQGFTQSEYKNVKFAVKSMKKIVRFLKLNTLNALQRKRARKNITILKDMASTMSNISKIDSSNVSSVGDALSNALSGVNSVEMDQVVAVTNMFNAFNGINKSENIINKFTESVKEFTETCKNLMDAMSQNTDAINNIDNSNISNVSAYDNTNEKSNGFIEINSNGGGDNGKSGGIRIANVDEVAKAFAEKINGALSVDVPDTQVQLLINGSGGNEWTITRY